MLVHFRIEKQKKRQTGFFNRISLKDSTYRHLKLLEFADIDTMCDAFMKASDFVAVTVLLSPYNVDVVLIVDQTLNCLV